MKIAASFLVALASAAMSFAGQSVVSVRTEISETDLAPCNRFSCKLKSAGAPGAFHRSNLEHNAVVCYNDTPGFMTFFVYSGDICGPANVGEIIRQGAQVYEIVVPPYQTSFTDRHGRFYWVGSRPGKWGIDPASRQLARL